MGSQHSFRGEHALWSQHTVMFLDVSENAERGYDRSGETLQLDDFWR